MSLSSLLLPHSALLGSFAVSRETPFVGEAWTLLPSTTDDVAGADQRFAVGVHLCQVGAGTVRALVVTSHDGLKWCAAGAGSLLDQDGAEVYEVVEPTRLLRFVAIVTFLGGTPAPGHVLAASLLSNGRFQLTKSGRSVSLALGSDTPVEIARKSGRATLPAGQVEVNVIFENPWPDALYAVVATPEGEPVACWISHRTALGFHLRATAPANQDTLVHWMATHD
jgi:hypothetical protein